MMVQSDLPIRDFYLAVDVDASGASHLGAHRAGKSLCHHSRSDSESFSHQDFHGHHGSSKPRTVESRCQLISSHWWPPCLCLVMRWRILVRSAVICVYWYAFAVNRDCSPAGRRHVYITHLHSLLFPLLSPLHLQFSFPFAECPSAYFRSCFVLDSAFLQNVVVACRGVKRCLTTLASHLSVFDPLV